MVVLKRLEAGLYETTDGRYRIDRVDSDDGEGGVSSVWTVTVPPKSEKYRDDNSMWAEIHETDTKRQCVLFLEKELRDSSG